MLKHAFLPCVSLMFGIETEFSLDDDHLFILGQSNGFELLSNEAINFIILLAYLHQISKKMENEGL